MALRLLPSAERAHLQAIYDVARVIDDLGDEAEGDRVALLQAFREDLRRIWDGAEPAAAVLRRLLPTVQACALEPEPFERLIQANLQDQTVTRYPTRDELIAYCALSADPVGRLVLAVYGAATPETVVLSDRICTALQILEHCQDVGEDYARDRIYLPQNELRRFGVREEELGGQRTGPQLERLVQKMVADASGLLAEGRPLIGMLSGTARLAVAGYLAGGLATIDALRRAHWNVLPTGPHPRKRDVARHAAGLLMGASR